MRKRFAGAFGMLIIFIFSSTVALAADPPAIQAIRQLYQQTNDGIASGELCSTLLQYGAATFDGIVEFEFFESENAQLRKVHYRRVSGILQAQEEYLYYGDGSLAFCLHKFTDVSTNEVHQEQRFYFQAGRLIRYIERQTVVDGPFSEEVRKSAVDFQKRAEELKKAFMQMPRLGRFW